MKHTNRRLLAKGIKNLAGSLPLVIAAPVIITSSFQNQDKPLFIPVLILGILLMFSAIHLIFRGIMIVMKAIFD